MGLPEDLWFEWTQMFMNVSDATCDTNLTDSTCVLPNSCETYTDLFSSYSFQIMFTSNTSSFIRVPLEAFAANQSGSCNINVVKLDTD